MNKTCAVFRAFAISTLLAGMASAVQFTATGDINGGSPYFGPNLGNFDVTGAINDGGFDAFDTFGYYTTVFPSSLTLNRRVELLPGNLFRWVDTFTNTGLSSMTTNVTFYGNLGSDLDTTTNTVNSYFQVSSDGSANFDPVVGIIWGDNLYAASFQRTLTLDNFTLQIPLTLAASESTSLMYFTFLARELTNRSQASDIALALGEMNALFASPNITGLSAAEQSSIANWSTVPEPGTYLSMGLGLAAIGWLRRRSVKPDRA